MSIKDKENNNKTNEVRNEDKNKVKKDYKQ